MAVSKTLTTSRIPWVYSAEEALEATEKVIGSKANQLAYLSTFVDKVPPWFVVSATSWISCLDQAGQNDAIAEKLQSLQKDADTDMVSALGKTLQAVTKMVEVPDSIRSAIRYACGSTFPANSWLAVRPSPYVVKPEADYTGVFPVYLSIRHPDDIVKAVKDIWQAQFSPRVLAYRLKHGLSLSDMDCAVIVQEMIAPIISGTAKSATEESPFHVLIKSVYGTGFKLTRDDAEADSYTLNKQTGDIEAAIARKTHMDVQNDRGPGLKLMSVDRSDQENSTLNVEQVRRIFRAVQMIETQACVPQEVTFTIDWQDTIHFLQTRPLPMLDQAGPAAGNRILWDNTALQEHCPGVTTPMTYSILRRAHDLGAHCFARVTGISEENQREYSATFRSLIGLIHGRIYRHVHNWQALAEIVPDSDEKQELIRSLTWFDPALIDEEGGNKDALDMLLNMPKVLRTKAGIGWQFAMIENLTNDFLSQVEDTLEDLQDSRLDKLSLSRLAGMYRIIEEDILSRWDTPILVNMFTTYHERKALIIARKAAQNHPPLQDCITDLLLGHATALTPAPILRTTAQLMERVQATPALAVLMLQESATHVLAELHKFPECEKLFQAALHRHGHLLTTGMKLETMSLAESPAVLISILQTLLQASESGMDAIPITTRIQKANEQSKQALKALNDGSASFFTLTQASDLEKALDRYFVGRSLRTHIEHVRNRLAGLIRRWMMAVGSHFVRQKMMSLPEDAFYLTIEELLDLIDGCSISTSLHALVSSRRAEYQQYRREKNPPATRFQTFGIPYTHNQYAPLSSPQPPISGDLAKPLSGTAIVRGKVQAVARVIPNHDSVPTLMAGQILVVDSLPESWLPLLTIAGGLVLSSTHTGTVAISTSRAICLPTLIGVQDVTSIIQDGQSILLDAENGVVSVVEENKQQETPGTSSSATPETAS